MSTFLRATFLVLVTALAACDAPSDDVAAWSGELDSAPVAVGPWTYVGSDVQPSNRYAITGDGITVDFHGYFTINGTWSTGYHGYSFAAPANLVEGATYQLTLQVSNESGGVPVVLKAALTGAGPEQTQMRFGNGPIQMTFTVGALGGQAPGVLLTAHPVLGGIGPLPSTGIGIQGYHVAATLQRID